MSSKTLISYIWKGVGLAVVIVVAGFILNLIQEGRAMVMAKKINEAANGSASNGTTDKVVDEQNPTGFAKSLAYVRR